MSRQPAHAPGRASDWGDEWSSEADVRRTPGRQRAAPTTPGAVSVDELARALAEFESESEPESAEPLAVLEPVLATPAAEVVAHVAVHEVEAEQLQPVTPKKYLDRYIPIS